MEQFILKAQEQRSFNQAHLVVNELGQLRIDLPYQAAFGGGERYNTVNLKGQRVKIQVEEKFCEQFDKTYCPMPFFFTDSGFGFFADTACTVEFAFEDDFILVDLPLETEITLFSGNARSIIAEFMALSGAAVLPPDYAFLPWISANHWNSQKKVEEQLANLKKYDFPAGVIVLEAWSDEATFYIFNGAKYAPKADGTFVYEDFTFEKDSLWPNPKAMIEQCHAAGLKVVLWQIPAYKKQEASEIRNVQSELDRAHALAEELCVRTVEGKAYEIPEGNWFAGAYIPDFTKKETRDDWFAKRQYLLDIGIDGFKTDGGEFIYREDLQFADGTSGDDLKNRYPQTYTQAYSDFLPDNHLLFSRAGFVGQHTTPILWAGDQKSTFSELRAQLKAGLSAAMSGIIFWGFDIAGFAGALPSSDLYLRATQLACFCPIMQWHSEMEGGQFRDLMATEDVNNERSPWNIAKRSGDEKLLERTRFYHHLRVELQPYIQEQARKCVQENSPLLRPLSYEFFDDVKTFDIVDEFMFGNDFLVAPILEEKAQERQVYLPAGVWEDFWTGKRYQGNQTLRFAHEWQIAVYKKVME